MIRLADWAAKALLSAFGVSITRSWAEEEIDKEGEAGRRPGSRGELRSRMGEVLRGGGLSAERQQEVFNALAIDELPVREMMVEREGIVALHAEDDLDANLALVGERPHTRFPLVGDEPEEFLGVVYSPALFDRLDAIREGTLDLREVATPPMSVPAAIAVSELIDRFQAERKELALVTERADTAGSDGAAEESTPSRGALRGGRTGGRRRRRRDRGRRAGRRTGDGDRRLRDDRRRAQGPARLRVGRLRRVDRAAKAASGEVCRVAAARAETSPFWGRLPSRRACSEAAG